MLQHLKINDGMESTRTLQDFTSLKFPGDDVDALGEWVHIVERLAKKAIDRGIPAPLVYSTLWDKARYSKRMQTKLEVYQVTHPAETRKWEDLVRITHEVLEVGRSGRLRDQHQAHMQTLSKGQPKGRGQQALGNAAPAPHAFLLRP